MHAAYVEITDTAMLSLRSFRRLDTDKTASHELRWKTAHFPPKLQHRAQVGCFGPEFDCIGFLGSALGYIRQHRVGLLWSASGSDPGSGIRSPGNPDGRDRASIRDPIRDPVHDPIQNPIRDPIRIPIREPVRGR